MKQGIGEAVGDDSLANSGAAEQVKDFVRARALRFRLADHAAAAGRWQDALAALDPLRRLGDELARAWSLDLAQIGRAHV